MAHLHTVQQGEGVSRIAELYGFAPDTLWLHPENTELRGKRKDANILLPGDEVYIPDKVQKSVSVGTGRSHRFKKRGVPARLRLRLMHDGRPRAGAPFRVVVDGAEISGTLDDDGQLDVTIAPLATSAQLFVGEDPPIELALGGMDPIETLSGVQKRLTNLSLYSGPLDGRPSPSLTAAISAFREQHGPAGEAELDDAFRERLVRVHDERSR